MPSSSNPAKTSFMQPSVAPLPSDLSLTGLVAIVTGATSGLGFETARQLLQHGASQVVLGVRSTSRGETAASSLLADPTVKSRNPSGKATVLRLDVESLSSVTEFAAEVQRAVPVLNVLVLNAGFLTTKFERTAEAPQHERGLTAMALANALLSVALLPHMTQSAATSGRQGRIVWVGSRMSILANSAVKKPLGEHEAALALLDDPARWSMMTSYGDVKLMVYGLVDEMGRRLQEASGTKGGNLPVAVNQVCPGMIRTGFNHNLPWYMRPLINVVVAIRGRSPETGGSIITHAAVVAKDGEANRAFFHDKDVGERWDWLDDQGKDFVAKLWKETMVEIGAYTEVPDQFKS